MCFFLLIIYICGQQIRLYLLRWGVIQEIGNAKSFCKADKKFRQDQVYFYFPVNIPWFASTISCPFVLTTYKYIEKEKVQILFSAKRWIGHFVSRSYQELVSFKAPSTLPLANIMSPSLSVNFEKHCSQQSPPDLKLYLGELFSEHLNLIHTSQPGTSRNSFIYLFEKWVPHKNWQKRIFSINVWSGSSQFLTWYVNNQSLCVHLLELELPSSSLTKVIAPPNPNIQNYSYRLYHPCICNARVLFLFGPESSVGIFSPKQTSFAGRWQYGMSLSIIGIWVDARSLSNS